MLDYQTYKTKKDALRTMSWMRGWYNLRAEHLHLPEDENANRNGDAWVIAVGPRERPQYMRRDGFVR